MSSLSFDSETLMNLDRFNTVVKMQKDGKTLPAFNMQTPAPPSKPEDAKEESSTYPTQGSGSVCL